MEKDQARFVDICDNMLEACKRKPTSKNTEKAYQWAFNVFREWVKVRSMNNEYREDLWSEDSEKVC